MTKTETTEHQPLLITNGVLVNDDRSFKGDIFCQNGIIKAVWCFENDDAEAVQSQIKAKEVCVFLYLCYAIK